jgi:hypothetical protein
LAEVLYGNCSTPLLRHRRAQEEADGARLAASGRHGNKPFGTRVSYLHTGSPRILEGSFIPPRPIRELRDLTRYRVHLVEEVNRVKNRISGMCEADNIKVASVATDLFGASGRRMLQAVVEGNRDAGWMADYAQGRLRQKMQELALALEGDFTDGQRWLLGQELGHLRSLEEDVSYHFICGWEHLRSL